MAWSQEPARAPTWPCGCFACGRQDLASVIVAYHREAAVTWLCEQCAESALHVQQFTTSLARALPGEPLVLRTFPGVLDAHSAPSV